MRVVSTGGSPLLAGRLTAMTLAVVLSGLAGSARGEETEAATPIDVMEEVWGTRQGLHRFLIIAASSTTTEPLEYVEGDADDAEQVLTALGYSPLSEDCGVLKGAQATRDQITRCVKRLNTSPSSSVFFLYFSGHAVPDQDGGDLWLQTPDTRENGSGYGVTFNGLLNQIGAFQGWAVFVIDACMSGAAGSAVTFSALNDTTAILTSSSRVQPSAPISLPDNRRRSAFSHVLFESLSEWDSVDMDGDGVIGVGELAGRATARLAQLRRSGDLAQEMVPHQVGPRVAFVFLAYRPDKARVWQTAIRQYWLEVLTREALSIKGLGMFSTLERRSLTVPPRARALAAEIGDNASPFGLALRDIARDQPESALARLSNRKALGDVPQDWVATAQARAYAYSGDYAKALEAYRKVLPPRGSAIHVEAAYVALLANDSRTAERWTRSALAVRTLDYDSRIAALNNLGLATLAQGHPRRADGILHEALATAAGEATVNGYVRAVVLNNRGATKAAIGDNRYASKLYALAVEGLGEPGKSPQSDEALVKALFNQAGALTRMGRGKEAMRITNEVEHILMLQGLNDGI